ncbi:DOPA 4,5-dioxygenase family protein [Nordella sp. HKS 07]|uniref:DOPA 4,5-dioxygenase family protein n=1 Tax=Nordella sp. HKS 07 TaxID=2712222 RepID=UPI0019D24889|nr:DOPA 4,5-dioxygenase family protein [Nordella sp. HKS 07]
MITGYHAHVYYDAPQRAEAQRLCETVRDRFSIAMGRLHDQAVGPHPRGSCQLTVSPEQFSDVIQWLIANRGGFTIFAHALSGDEIKDHTDHVIWLGPSEALDLSKL